jgi:hypothetical protein
MPRTAKHESLEKVGRGRISKECTQVVGFLRDCRGIAPYKNCKQRCPVYENFTHCEA